MTKQNKIPIGVGAVLLIVGIGLWSQKVVPPVALPPAAASAPSAPAPAGPQVQAVATPPQSQPASIATMSGKRFSDMEPLERNAIKNEIAKQDLPSIFKAMLDAERVERDGIKQMQLSTTFAGALRRKTPNPEFLEQLRAFVANGSNSNFERQLVLGALTLAATKETVDLLIQIATTSPDEKIRQAAGAIGPVGDLGGAGEKLSPSLERAWRESSDRGMLTNAASAMAKIGTPSGIELLLSAALAPGARDKTREAAAQYALEKIYSPIAVPPLAARLDGQPATSEAAKLIAPIIVRIGDFAAGKAVVSWLQNRDENAAPLIRDLVVQQMRSDQMRSAWKAALDPAVPFRNEQNREAIRASLVLRSP